MRSQVAYTCHQIVKYYKRYILRHRMPHTLLYFIYMLSRFYKIKRGNAIGSPARSHSRMIKNQDYLVLKKTILPSKIYFVILDDLSWSFM